VQELGYPSYKMLIRWYKEFKETGALHEKFTRSSTYTSDQMKAAVNYYLEHGRCISRTVRAIGYPTRETLAGWIDKLVPGERKIRIRRGAMLQFSKEQNGELAELWFVFQIKLHGVPKYWRFPLIPLTRYPRQ
jgi:putative transposase